MKEYGVVAFVPLKQASRRIPGKNFFRLGGKPLFYYILESLKKVEKVDRIFVYASNREVIGPLPENIEFLKRPVCLDHSSVRGNAIYRSFCDQIHADVYLLAHATSPYLLPATLQQGLNAVLSRKYDSAFACHRYDTYAWFKKKPLNFRPEVLPRTQNLEPVYLETNGFYIFRRDLMVKHHRRIGIKPYLCEVGSVEGLDIDYPEDLRTAEKFFPLYRQMRSHCKH
jgi:CMP-N-acetylneuraminic acid synthetase